MPWYIRVRSRRGGDGARSRRVPCRDGWGKERRGEGIGNGEEELERHSDSFIEIALWGSVEGRREEPPRPERKSRQGGLERESRLSESYPRCDPVLPALSIITTCPPFTACISAAGVSSFLSTSLVLLNCVH